MMTPEERARADSINDAISASVRQRKEPQTQIPNSSFDLPNKTGNGLRYAAFVAIVLAVHIAGFLAYRHYAGIKKYEDASRRAAEQAQARAVAEAATALARANAELARAEAERARLLAQQQAAAQSITFNQPQQPPIPPPRKPTTRPVAQQPAKTSISPEECAEKYATWFFSNVVSYGPLRVEPSNVSIRRTVTTTVIENQRYKTTGQAHITYTGSTGGDVSEVRYFAAETESRSQGPTVIRFTPASGG